MSVGVTGRAASLSLPFVVDGNVAPWRCPVCRAGLALDAGRRSWGCEAGHGFDIAREGYVNLLMSGRRRSRAPGDSAEMVAARRRFLGTGAYDPMTEAIAEAVAAADPAVVLDVGCGEGRHTRGVRAPLVLGCDVAKPAVAAAAKADRAGWYAVASAADLPLDDAAVDVALDVFGPVAAAELARVLRPGGLVVTAHPGPDHLSALRALVYPDGARPHTVKPPLRATPDLFTEQSTHRLTFEITAPTPDLLHALFAMTPYRWHATPNITTRLTSAAPLTTPADIQLTLYRRS